LSSLPVVLLSSLLLAGLPAKKAPDDESTTTLHVLSKPFPAPDFTLKGEDGTVYRLSDFRGKVVVLNFWATWCPPCRFEMPSLERAWHKLRQQNVMILAVDVGESEDTIWEFTAIYSVSFPIPLDRDGSLTRKYPVIGLPTTFIVNPDGVVTHRTIGAREWDHPRMIEQLLKMRKPIATGEASATK